MARRVAAANGVDLGARQGLGPGRQGDQGRRAGGGQRRRRRRDRAAAHGGEAKPLRGPAAMLAQAMNESRSMPTATSFRTLAVDVLDAKRKALNGVAQGARDEGLVHPPDRLGDRQGGAASGR